MLAVYPVNNCTHSDCAVKDLMLAYTYVLALPVHLHHNISLVLKIVQLRIECLVELLIVKLKIEYMADYSDMD